MVRDPMMRAPMALGGGSSTKGMPAPRVAVSQRIRIQAPKIAGTRSLSAVSLPRDLVRTSTISLTLRQASNQQAAINRKNGLAARPSLLRRADSSIHAPPWAPMNSTVARLVADCGMKENSADAAMRMTMIAVAPSEVGRGAVAANSGSETKAAAVRIRAISACHGACFMRISRPWPCRRSLPRC
jgi:hypothetical protein